MQSATSASAQSATQTTINPILTASEQASENAAMAKMFAEVHKAEATANAPQVTTIHAVMQAVDTASTAQDMFAKMSGLFGAIMKISDEYSTIRSVAETGQYLAEDFGNFNDCIREEWQRKLDALKAASSSEGVTA